MGFKYSIGTMKQLSEISVLELIAEKCRVKFFVRQYTNFKNAKKPTIAEEMLAKIIRTNGTRRRHFGTHKIHGSTVLSPSCRPWQRMIPESSTKIIPHTVNLHLRRLHNWENLNQERRKIIPKLVYLHNPWKYLLTKLNLWKLKWMWDPQFNEAEFIEGAKQAAIVMTDIIRHQTADKISEFTTPVGFQQITRDMLLSRNDARLQLVRFQKEHLRRAIPMKVATRHNFGRKYAFIDMLFVGLRNTKDFDSPNEAVEINDIIRRMDSELKTPNDVISVPHRIVFAEIFIRFRRDYSAEKHSNVQQENISKWSVEKENAAASASIGGTSATSQNAVSRPMSVQNPASTALPLTGRILPRSDDSGWAVSFYKILTFDVLNYDPQHKK